MVKAFNTLSAWALQNGPADASRQVLSESLDFVAYLMYISASTPEALPLVLPNYDTLGFTLDVWIRLASTNVFNSQMYHTVGMFLS